MNITDEIPQNYSIHWINIVIIKNQNRIHYSLNKVPMEFKVDHIPFETKKNCWEMFCDPWIPQPKSIKMKNVVRESNSSIDVCWHKKVLSSLFMAKSSTLRRFNVQMRSAQVKFFQGNQTEILEEWK